MLGDDAPYWADGDGDGAGSSNSSGQELVFPWMNKHPIPWGWGWRWWWYWRAAWTGRWRTRWWRWWWCCLRWRPNSNNATQTWFEVAPIVKSADVEEETKSTSRLLKNLSEGSVWAPIFLMLSPLVVVSSMPSAAKLVSLLGERLVHCLADLPDAVQLNRCT